MPNWCECDLTVRAEKREHLEAFKQAIAAVDRDGNPYLSILATQVPKPPILDQIISPVCIVPTLAEAREKNKEYLDMHGRTGDDERFRHITERAATWMRREWGADNWYDWAIMHWGTKWGDCETEIADEWHYDEHSDHALEIKFETAWSPPNEGLLTLSEKWPELEFTCRYFEGGMGFSGLYKCQNGDELRDEVADYFGSRGG